MAEYTESNEELENEAEEVTETAAEENDAAESPDNSEEKAPENEEEKGSIGKDIFEIIESTLITMFVIVMIFTYLLHPLSVQGHSMNDTLLNEDKILMCTLTFSPSYGDIVIINNDASYVFDEYGSVVKREITGNQLEECLIKRVIAAPGQTLKIDTDANTITVDGEVLSEPYTKPVPDGEDTLISGPAWFTGEITVPDGYYFVMGDNRNNSADSRNPNVGFIKLDQIYGTAVARYAPLKDFKILLFNK
ncbi:MAG: signal peptidase I [Ruminococcus sp.]|nr:signal peptidase I [Ruminococcus sp.]